MYYQKHQIELVMATYQQGLTSLTSTFGVRFYRGTSSKDYCVNVWVIRLIQDNLGQELFLKWWCFVFFFKLRKLVSVDSMGFVLGLVKLLRT